MSKIYSLTKIGRKAYKNSSASGEEMRVLDYLRANKSATDDQLEVVGGERWMIRRMVQDKLIEELN